MKAGLATSVAFHTLVIAFAIVSLSSPRAYNVADVEAMPVDIVPVESITQIQQGEKTAPKAEKAAPRPTSRPDTVPDATKVGDNEVDSDAPPKPDVKPKPKPVETASAPPPPKEPTPKPEIKPEPKPEPQEAKPEPVPATEKAVEAKPQQEVEPDPVKEAIVAESEKADAVKLPEQAPLPDARPQPPKAQTARAPEHKEADKPAPKQATAQKSQEDDKVLDQVAALLNKEKTSGGGAKRSNEQASLGGQKTTGGDKLSQSEMDALRGQIQKCWSVPAGAMDAEDLKVSIQFKLDQSGALVGSPQIVDGGGGSTVQRAAAESARRAILMCQPYNLPADKYAAWADVIVHFDPTDMF